MRSAPVQWSGKTGEPYQAVCRCGRPFLCRTPENWLEVLAEAGLADGDSLRPLVMETNELTAIFVTVVKRVKAAQAKAE